MSATIAQRLADLDNQIHWWEEQLGRAAADYKSYQTTLAYLQQERRKLARGQGKRKEQPCAPK